MKKAILKRILLILDDIEHDGIDLNKAKDVVYNHLKQNQFLISRDDVNEIISLLFKHQCIKSFQLGIDLGAVATIYARSNLNSDIEALACFEMFIKNEHVSKSYQVLLKDDLWYSKETLINYLGKDLFDMQCQTSLYDTQNERYRLRSSLRIALKQILKEYDTRKSFYVSSTLLARFADSIIPELQDSEYRNMDKEITNYDYKNDILNVLPKCGIPSNRDVTKALQTFYKDTLFHEFDHQCPICNIHLPHMLIASHIKPFRDCAHIYEPIDHNNGLLLCKNHDYLFDQGFFSFLDDGSVFMCDELLNHEPFDAFHIPKDFKLPKRYLSKERKAFLAYHRQNIYKHK